MRIFLAGATGVTPPPAPRVHVGEAARATVALLDAEPGIVEIVEDGDPA